MQLKLGILGSARGTDMLALIHAIEQKRLNASIEIVLSNKEEAIILDRAKQHGLKTIFADPQNLSREAYDQKLSAIFQTHQVDLIVLIGYMRIISNNMISLWQNKIINVHPSLLPRYAGGMDNHIHQAVIENGDLETGCTVHYVTEEVDGGPLLIQKKCTVLPSDTIESLKTRVQALEGEALIEAIQKIGKSK